MNAEWNLLNQHQLGTKLIVFMALLKIVNNQQVLGLDEYHEMGTFTFSPKPSPMPHNTPPPPLNKINFTLLTQFRYHYMTGLLNQRPYPALTMDQKYSPATGRIERKYYSRTGHSKLNH